MNRKVYVPLFLLVCSISSQTQEINESFLSSLPDNIQKDVLQSDSNQVEETNYKNPNTRIQNLEKSLQEAERDLSRIRAQLDKNDAKDSNVLERFGANLFTSYQSTFLPINEPNFSSDYILDVGDELNVQIIGSMNKNKSMVQKIGRDGSLNLPDIGKVFISGLSLDKASQLIQTRVGEYDLGAQGLVSLSNIRDINVLVVGNVQNPGMYTVGAASTGLSVINVAGGINESGSYRNIQHKRNGNLLSTIDLYEIFIEGNFATKSQLRSGDVIIVGSKGFEASISGGVYRPAIYELLQDEKLEDLLRYSGLKTFNSSNRINLTRIDFGKFNSKELSLEESLELELQDGDAIEVYALFPEYKSVKNVSISGEINIPGTFSVSSDTTLGDIIKLAGGYTTNAYPFGGVLLRDSVKKKELEFRDKGFNEITKFIISAGGNSKEGNSESLLPLLGLLKDYQPVGRVVSEFELSILDSQPSSNIVLQDGDEIHIPAFSNLVYVFGEVGSGGAYKYVPNRSEIDYINSAGGFSRVADKNFMIIIKPNGEVVTQSKAGIGKFFARNTDILPGSVIYVPTKVGTLDGINLATAVAPIVSSVALSLASLNSINN